MSDSKDMRCSGDSYSTTDSPVHFSFSQLYQIDLIVTFLNFVCVRVCVCVCVCVLSIW